MEHGMCKFQTRKLYVNIALHKNVTNKSTVTISITIHEEITEHCINLNKSMKCDKHLCFIMMIVCLARYKYSETHEEKSDINTNYKEFFQWMCFNRNV